MRPTTKPIKLTSSLLKKIIEAEVKGLGDMEDVEDRAKDTKETDADELAGSLERPVDFKKANGIKESDTWDGHTDYMKALKIEEGRLQRRLNRVRSSLREAARKVVIARVV